MFLPKHTHLLAKPCLRLKKFQFSIFSFQFSIFNFQFSVFNFQLKKIAPRCLPFRFWRI